MKQNRLIIFGLCFSFLLSGCSPCPATVTSKESFSESSEDSTVNTETTTCTTNAAETTTCTTEAKANEHYQRIKFPYNLDIHIDLGSHLGTEAAFTVKKVFVSWPDTKDPKFFYELILPRFSGGKNIAFQNKANAIFDKVREDSIQDVTKAWKNEEENPLGYSDKKTYSVNGMCDGIISLTVYDDWFSGGVHSNQELTAYTLDFKDSKVVSLGDVFKPSIDYKARCLDMIRKVWQEGTGDYKDVNMPNSLNENNFFFQNENLVFFYQPYEISDHARGIVCFEIPLADIRDILSDRYKNLDFEGVPGF